MLAASSSGGSSSILLIYVVIFAALYFFYLRPRSRRQKAARAEARKVEVGQRAQTVGGIIGTITAMDDQTVTLRTDSGVELDFVATAIARRIDPVVPESSDDLPRDEASGETPEEGTSGDDQ